MMIKLVWEGRLPNYWDITQWTIIIEDKLYILNKLSGERSLFKLDPLKIEQDKMKTTSNVILGNYSDLIILGRLLDARSHISLRNVTAYNIHTFQREWRIKEDFLFEKYRVPYFNGTKTWNVGKLQVSLATGKVDTKSSVEDKNCYEMLIGQNDFRMFEFQGIIDNHYIYSNLSNDELYIVKPDSILEKIVKLEDLKHVNKSVFGTFQSERNNLSNDSTITSVLINSYCVVWVTNENNVIVHFYKTEKTVEIKNEFRDVDLCLNSITNKQVILYGIKSYEEGSILIINLEDL
ncbi:hypothetical protein [Bacillus pinisoli]|uniref:hypothetical protein n=1 Tax=Bacillus pinisoli TaxID=2901866 RepID=UPI001FF47F78|nr:hypothetical protein [Bacillus pinisoli]